MIFPAPIIRSAAQGPLGSIALCSWPAAQYVKATRANHAAVSAEGADRHLAQAHCKTTKPSAANLSTLQMIGRAAADHAMPRCRKKRPSKPDNSQPLSAHRRNGTHAMYSSFILAK